MTVGLHLTVTNANSAGGNVISDVGGINCGTICTKNYASGTAVKLTATPLMGHTFAGWGGDCLGSGKTSTCQLTLSAAKNVNANFLPNYTLTVTNTNKLGGIITSDSSGISCGNTCIQSNASGSIVTLTAIPSSGYQFTGWCGDCSGYGNSCTVTVDTAKTVTANFAPYKIHQPVWKRAIGSIINGGG